MDEGGQIDSDTYTEVIVNSSFTLSPAGHNPECFRLFEAVEAGSIPVMVKSDLYITTTDIHPCREALKHWNDAPLLVLDNWDDLFPTMHKLLKNLGKLDSMQRDLQIWYEKYMKQRVRDFEDFMIDDTPNSEVDATTFAIKGTGTSDETTSLLIANTSISLIVSFWANAVPDSKTSLHYHEMEAAFIANLANQYLSQLVIILDSVSKEANCSHFERRILSIYAKHHTNSPHVQKLICIPHTSGQPTYLDMFRYVTHDLVTSRVAIVANADHVFDNTLRHAGLLRQNTVLTLSSHGYYTEPSGSATLVPPNIQQYYTQIIPSQLMPKPTQEKVVRNIDRCNDVPEKWNGKPFSWDAFVFERRLLQGTIFNESSYWYRKPHGYFYMNTNGAEVAALHDLLQLIQKNLPKNERSISVWNACQHIHAFHYHFARKTHNRENGSVPGPKYFADLLSETNYSLAFDANFEDPTPLEAL